MPFETDVLATRFGYGLPLNPDTPRTADAMIAALSGPDTAQAAYPLPSLADVTPQMRKVLDLQHQLRKGVDKKAEAALRKARGQLNQMSANALRTSIARTLDTPDSFRERLVGFWTNHFCTLSKTAATAYLPALMVEEAIRPNLNRSFADLLIASTTHPAMVLYLDQNTNIGPDSPAGLKRHLGLNENLGREVMELHSLGVGAPYTQTDVRQMSKLLTGLTYEIRTGSMFNSNRVEPGAETVLGKTYGGKGMEPIRAVLTDIAARPETAQHIATQLAGHFIADTPPVDLVAAMKAAYLASDGQLLAVYRAMLAHPAAAAAPGAKVRWPTDYIATGLRALGMTGATFMALPEPRFRRASLRALRNMGMPWLSPAGPNGFPDAAGDWINPPYLAARIDWAMNVPEIVLKAMPEPAVLAKTALGDRATPELVTAVSRAETKVEGVGLVLASTEMNRR